MRNCFSAFNIAVIGLLFYVLMPSLATGQTRRQKEISHIDTYVKKLNSMAKRNTRPDLIVADISDYDRQSPRWKKFSSSESLEKFRSETDIFNSANNWLKEGKLVMSAITLSSPSGDWAKYLDLYFRRDGTLAKSESELRTFDGEFAAKQNFYFDRKGNLLKRTLKYFDLSTDKPKKPGNVYLTDNLSFINEDIYYKTVARLPFAHLIPR